MRTWAELEAVAPEITAFGRDLLERFQFVLVGTLTEDGSPRVNPYALSTGASLRTPSVDSTR